MTNEKLEQRSQLLNLSLQIILNCDASLVCKLYLFLELLYNKRKQLPDGIVINC